MLYVISQDRLYTGFFLIKHMPSQLANTTIYCFLIDPERSLNGAAFFGLWLMSNSKLALVLALASHLRHWWFISCVEHPHTQRLYHHCLRKEGGLAKPRTSRARHWPGTWASTRTRPSVSCRRCEDRSRTTSRGG
ncbi:hypothetical protein IAT38_005841 [Cryptococcus sp. DSM 104549]